jgi:hypothetical protein
VQTAIGQLLSASNSEASVVVRQQYVNGGPAACDVSPEVFVGVASIRRIAIGGIIVEINSVYSDPMSAAVPLVCVPTVTDSNVPEKLQPVAVPVPVKVRLPTFSSHEFHLRGIRMFDMDSGSRKWCRQSVFCS